MLFPISNFLGRKITLNDILKAAIIPQEPQLNDMVTELLPLHGLIAININFLEKVNQRQSNFML
jgi:hypothetical protein